MCKGKYGATIGRELPFFGMRKVTISKLGFLLFLANHSAVFPLEHQTM
jgi:hypothetical protein